MTRVRHGGVLASFVLLWSVAPCNAQSIEMGKPESVFITPDDTRRGTGRYKEFLVDFRQGDRLSVDIQGGNGVAVGSAVFILPGDQQTSHAFDYSEAAEHLQWMSKPIRQGRHRVRIVAYQPYGLINVLLDRVGPDGRRVSDASQHGRQAQAPGASDDLSSLSTRELLDKRTELLRQVGALDREIERRASQRPQQSNR